MAGEEAGPESQETGAEVGEEGVEEEAHGEVVAAGASGAVPETNFKWKTLKMSWTGGLASEEVAEVEVDTFIAEVYMDAMSLVSIRYELQT